MSEHIEGTILCTTCGTQHMKGPSLEQQHCKICEDPRQYVPATGQHWTEWKELSAYHNVIQRLKPDLDVWVIHTEPKLAIGQRCFFIKTAQGNVLWDCITLLDESTVSFIRDKGGLDAVVISHPHYYTTHLGWAKTFGCPIYIAAEDEEWCVMPDEHNHRKLVGETVQTIVPGIEAIKLGGHFPGSLVLRYQPAKARDAHLFIADTIMVSMSGLSPDPRPPGMTSFNFMWSYPNTIPLSAEALYKMWLVLQRFDFGSTHGAFPNQDIWARDVKVRVLESMQIQARFMGWTDENADILRIAL